MSEKPFRSGFVSIIGRPNVGKSTLLNNILGDKIAITSDKPQTTRNRVQGISNIPGAQIVFIDTPEDIRDKYQYFTEARMDMLHRAGYDKAPQPLEETARDYVRNYLDQGRYLGDV